MTTTAAVSTSSKKEILVPYPPYFLIFFRMVSIFDAVVLDWWMFTKTDIFGILIKKKTGRMPDVMRVDPQWDGKEFLKLFPEVIISVVLAWIFIKVR